MGEVSGNYLRRKGIKINRTLIEITPHILGVQKITKPVLKSQDSGLCSHAIH